MANKIILKKSSVAGKIPLATDLDVGEVALNLADKTLYSKDAGGTVIQIGGGSGTGDVVGPSSATDNAIARFDTTTGKLIQNSVVTVSDTGAIAGATTITDINYVDFNTGYTTTLGAGQLGWDGNNTLGLGMTGGNVIQEIGLQLYIYGKASSAVTKGQLIKKTGVNGTSGVITFAPTTANMTNSDEIIGIAAESIALNGFGYIISTGNIKGFNTTGSSSSETWADGDPLYYNPSGSGLMTNVKPSAPNLKVQIGVITNASSGGSGSMVVEINHGSTLGGTDSNVQITSPTNGQILTYDTSNTYWKNTTLNNGTGISISAATGGALTITNSAPDQTVAISGTSPVSVTGTYPNFTVAMSQSNTSTNGYLSSTDWNTFNGKQAAYTNLTTIGSLANGTGWLYNNGSGTFSYSTPTKTDVGLGNVTNDAQTKAAIVPNTAPTAGQILVGNAGGTAYAPVSMSGDATLASTGAATLATVNSNVGSFTYASVTVNAKGLVTAVSSGTTPVTSVPAKMIYDTFTATASQTSFTTSNTYTSGKIDVYCNGVRMVNGTDVTVTSTTAVVFGTGLAVGTRVDLVYPI